MSCIDNDIWQKHNLVWIGCLLHGQCLHTCRQTIIDKCMHTHAHTQSTGSWRANSIFLSSRQIQFSSRTYVSWLKQPTKTAEICHILQDWTQNWVLLWQWDVSSHCFLSKSVFLFPSHNPFFFPYSLALSFKSMLLWVLSITVCF